MQQIFLSRFLTISLATSRGFPDYGVICRTAIFKPAKDNFIFNDYLMEIPLTMNFNFNIVVALDHQHLELKKMTEQIKLLTKAQQISGFNQYLAFGHGRGRLAFEATEYQGKIGYFFIRKIVLDGVECECLSFSDGTNEEGFIDLLPILPKCERIGIAKMKTELRQ